MANVIIFGIEDFASLAHFYLEHDSEHEVAAFCVSEDYLPEDRTFRGFPIEPFEAVADKYPPGDFQFFAPMSPRRMNRLRAEVFQKVKASGYECISYVSSKATVFPETPIGENCFILEDNTIQPFASVGDNVVLWSGNHIGHHGEIKDHVMFSSHVVLSGHCAVEPYSYFGVNATIRDGLAIAEGTFVAMGACLTKSTEAWSMYVGVPARRKGPSEDLDL